MRPRWRRVLVMLLGGLLGASAVALIVIEIRAWRLARRRAAVAALVYAAADRHCVDPALIFAVIHQESRFRPDVRGDAGEIGLMQITPGAARDWERAQHRQLSGDGLLFAPEVNIEVGTWYLSQGLRQFAHHPEGTVLALCQYNAGRRRALDWEARYRENLRSEIPFPSTRHYISSVMAFRSRYTGSPGDNEHER